jgi:hypothetical protein
MLRETSPYATGQLRYSIQPLQLNDKQWLVTIGNGTAIQRRIPSEAYAHITNDYQTLGKNNKPNKHYHWVNKTIKKWAEENILQFQIESDDDDE